MKFFTLIALAGTAFAARLAHKNHGHHNDFHVIHHALTKAKAHKHLKIKSMLRARWDDLTDEQMEEIGAWFEKELTTGEETITWEELHNGITSFGESHGFAPLSEEDWAAVKEFFDGVDTNSDGAWDLAELSALVEDWEE